MTKLDELAGLGQSIWLDYIRRSFVRGGGLQGLIDLGLRGMTSNPSIFEKAIAHSSDYDEDLERLARQGKNTAEIYASLTLEDIQQAADLLRQVYDLSGGDDGYVSLEVNPTLAHDTQGTISEAKRLWSEVDRPNLMVKIPATKAGLPAITEATASGINVNVTLIFSLERYAEVMAAYLAGLELRLGRGLPIDHIASVASFFVSRVDTKVDKLLEEIVRREGRHAKLAVSLLGQAAVANAKIAYSQFETVFGSASQPDAGTFAPLRAKGGRLQKPLWASTSTKNPTYSDIMYVQELIGPHTVNTLPQETLEFFLDHGEVRQTLTEDLDQSRFVFESLEDIGISMEKVTQELEDEGVTAFSKSFESLMDTIEAKRKSVSPAVVKDQQVEKVTPLQIKLNEGEEAFQDAMQTLAETRILSRIWQRDHTVWKPDPTEISNRLGWLDIFERIRPELPRIESLSARLQSESYTHALLLGMGGSSLAPDLFSRTFGKAPGGLDLAVLDSTTPGAVLAQQERLDPSRTVFIVSTKSGSTEETLSFFKYFYNWVSASLGEQRAGEHFIAITDPGSNLTRIASRYHFRDAFLNDPNIGGRYSALSFFGLLPAALCGVDVARLIERASAMAKDCGPDVPLAQNPAVRLGALLGVSARAGRDKATFILSPQILSFGDWVEQLIAESTGKEGRGILPVVGEPLSAPASYGRDRIFVHIYLSGDTSNQAEIGKLESSGFTVGRIQVQDIYDLGGQFFLWELATAIAGHELGINPFDQPNVESAKKRAREMTAAFKQSGKLPSEQPLLSQDGIAVYANESEVEEWGLEVEEQQPKALQRILPAFLSQARSGDYITLQAFIQPGEEASQALRDLRLRLRDRYRLATTSGYGPRFLHSTGQLHKGDAGDGLFIQFTEEAQRDTPIPDEAGGDASSISFGVLVLAQANGDRQALMDAGRRVIRLHFSGDSAQGIRLLSNSIH
jgi:transaldolase/glucose-6-phosphate isomerase